MAQSEGRPVKYPLTNTVYLVQNGTGRPFPDADTFEKMGYVFKDIFVFQRLPHRFPDGPGLPTLATATTQTKSSKKQQQTKGSLQR